MGDLFMCGQNIIGAFTEYKSGHALNNKMLPKDTPVVNFPFIALNL
ncbi:UDP-3-O-acyl-N-acetylglucosamine deacetylase [Riemerella anatipestifer]